MLEQLETRRLLAGNVTAVADGAGVVIITGDNKSNDVQVTVDGFFDVRVIPVSGTTVNGGTSDVVFPGTNLSLRSAVITTDNGEDNVEVIAPYFNDLSIDTGNGKDSVNVHTGIFIEDKIANLNVDTGNGDDLVRVAITSLVFTEIGNNLTINTGNGSDKIELAGDLDIGGNLTIDGGSAPDILDLTGVVGGSVAGATNFLNIETLIT
jgi:hypothetical protein